jgi:glycosyltransferase involved in cell wall biosynthesis
MIWAKGNPSLGKSDVLIVLNFYHPHVSGLTDSARSLAEYLVSEGKTIKVICCRHERDSPSKETINGVLVRRSRVVGRIRNGLLSPSFLFLTWAHARNSSIVNLHLPMIEAGILSRFISHKKLVTTYHCDYVGPKSRTGVLLENLIDISSRIAINKSLVTVTTSSDYSINSRISQHLINATVIPPPFVNRSGGHPSFRDGNGFHYGFIGRITAEKGLDILIKSFLQIAQPQDRLLIAGKGGDGVGESVLDLVLELVKDDKRIILLGFIPSESLPDFYASIDVCILPSTTRIEAFGIVQLEALSAGTPVIASNLPGVRTIIELNGNGLLVKPNCVEDLSRAMIEIHSLSKINFNSRSTSNEEYATLFNQILSASTVSKRKNQDSPQAYI